MLDGHYSAERCVELKKYDEFPVDGAAMPRKGAYLRGTTKGGMHVFNIAAVTCAIGQQLLVEEGRLAAGH
ncbi:hypothetical protein EMIHUDRAFT_309514 [Emiliania huxleyi CCMP1516]|uniref:Uncharacterized protein n=2 Tax=Emiliania huxleyi TaxID=2903 RepID=A0A0D3KBR6_EMIH1|nr:hypothetical protein EMIHUDRAFT_350943 [Emiliania huxleyi CCMP1516]XP_005785630.1 hypothetical protein EMIHUDRAFT_309514 [Emiliania huxleyi CCMP1516]EOD07295.1 hypothetical protein EMIHUDRAFT_350943 [Emiliania huxleyi CCMP1516]EOD33201.1 hypothetical protein EMIHUDRAFT_309514 [Emiliania huxleyi CCMP1516]|eukprot:XP_005759724.1 hypothetical protein EMIHUDRAFT_350943 [Emiliania huxleyi CCMP1516]